MSAWVFVVQHRTVDLVAMSALRALRVDLGVGDALVSLRRDDGFVLEGDPMLTGPVEEWEARCLRQPNWYNPNKHRYGLFRAQAGAQAAVLGDGRFPAPWLGELRSSDRPDLVDPAGAGWSEWVGCNGTPVTLAAWDRETPVKSLPGRDWPGPARVARLHLWTLGLDPAAGDAETLARRCAVTTERRQGLLVNPHMQGWTLLPQTQEAGA